MKLTQQDLWNDPNHGYMGNTLVKRAGIKQQFSEAQTQEYLRCMTSPAYFVRNYMKIISLDRGLVNFDLWAYQEKMFEHFEKHRFSIVLAPRQAGKSISVVGYLLWYALFHQEKFIAILANKGATSREMLSRVTLALENIPFFLQPGCKALNKGSIEFDGNVTIFAAATSSSSIRGKSVSLLYLDEFAFVENAATFYTSTYPVVTSGTSTKVIITSTPKGIGNMFHRLWEGAVQGVNEYKPFKVNWYDVPGRDEAWKQQTIANTSEAQWRQEFCGEFLGSGNTLIDVEHLLKLKSAVPLYSQAACKVYERPDKTHNYIITVDTAKGRGQDSSTFNIIDVSVQPMRQVAVYKSNTISPLLLPDIVFKYARMYNEAYVIIESNDSGSVVANGLYYELEYENMFVESSVKAGAIGCNMTKKIKRIGCSNLKDLIENNKLWIQDSDTIEELSAFEANGDSFEAVEGAHDDIVMSLVMFSWFCATDLFSGMTNQDLKTLLYEEKLKTIEDELVPVGFIDSSLMPTLDVVVDSAGNVWEKTGETTSQRSWLSF